MNTNEYENIWKASLIHVTDEFSLPPIVLQAGEAIIGTLGNFSVSTESIAIETLVGRKGVPIVYAVRPKAEDGFPPKKKIKQQQYGHTANQANSHYGLFATARLYACTDKGHQPLVSLPTSAGVHTLIQSQYGA